MDSIKKLLRNNWDVILFVFIALIKLISLNFTLKLGGFSQYTVIGSLGSILVFAGIACLFKRKVRIPLLFVFDLIITLIIYIDSVYNRYFLDVTTVALIKQLGITGDVKDSVFNLIKFKDILYFIDIIILLPLYIKFRKKINFNSSCIKKRIISFVVMIVVGISFSAISIFGLSKLQVGILKTFYDKKAVVREVGDLNYHAIDIYKYINDYILKKSTITPEEKEEVQTFFKQKESQAIDSPKYYGVAKGKNLIVIQLEAFQSFVLNKKINGVEITPNLNKLAKESLNFNNYFFETAMGGTSDAEFLSNVSLLPAKEGSVYYQYAGNEFNSLPKALKSEGYYTAVMHANRPGFWNRQEMYKTLGFDKFESERDYNIDDVKILGLSDKSFFRQNIEKIKSYKQPFYTFMISLTSHFAFRDEQNSLKDVMDVGEYEGTLIGDFIKTAKYTDEALGQFLQELKDNGLYDNSVIALYGDHNAISSDKRDQLAKFVYGKTDISDLEWLNAQQVVSMIHVPGTNLKGEVDTVGGQMDLYPTLANLFGIKTHYTLGQDLLNTPDGFMVTRAGNFATDNIIYVKSEDKLYSRKTGEELNKDDYKEYFDKANNYLTMSDRIVENNLIKEFNGNNK